jgi:single-stranded-DNA-specific exonuclease
MAAGLAMQFRHLSRFRQGVSAALEKCVSGAEPTLTIDAEISLPELNPNLLNTLQKLAPFGAGNPPVTLAVKGLRVQHEALFGRARTHRKVTVGDTAGNSAQVIWWNSSDLPLPGETFDLALRITKDTWQRAREALQLLWVDAREVKVPEKAAPRKVIDLRGQSDTSAALSASLQSLVDDPAALFWTSDALPGVRRLSLNDPNLTRGGKLVLWQPPPGGDLLRQIISAAQPQSIYLVARPSRLDTLPAFMEHLMGAVKYALNRYGGRLQITAIATAMAHREGTVRLGLDWLVNRGKLRVIVKTEEVWVVRADNRLPRSDSDELQTALLELLRETAAYRAFVRSARVEALFDGFQNSPQMDTDFHR